VVADDVDRVRVIAAGAVDFEVDLPTGSSGVVENATVSDVVTFDDTGVTLLSPGVSIANGKVVAYLVVAANVIQLSGAFVDDAASVSLTIANLLRAWTEGEAFQATSVTRDSDGVPTSAVLLWPDGSAGTFTLTTKNSTWLAVDAYTVTHTDSGLTVTQAAVTRDSLGAITTKPALTVA
jgi:hypothetical protein